MADVSLEDLLILEGFDYKSSMGAKGEQFNIKECPACGNDKWKCYANAETGLGNCFSCGKTFNVFKFAGMILESRGAPVIDNRAIGKYLNDIRSKLGFRPKTVVAAKPVITTTSDIKLPFNQPLPYSDGWVHPYLLKRGINGSYARMFDLRYSAFGSWVYKDDKGETHAQSFAERILIPVYDLAGKLVTFQGRDVTEKSDIRYKFAGGLPGTARYLYNGHVALAQRARRIVMGEGAFDVIGIQKALDVAPEYNDTVPVGSWGKHLSKAKEGDDQVTALMKLKKHGLAEVIVLYDGEPAAYTEAVKAAEIMFAIGLKASVALMPANQDPGGADTNTILTAIRSATVYTRISAMRMKMRNPYQEAA